MPAKKKANRSVASARDAKQIQNTRGTEVKSEYGFTRGIKKKRATAPKPIGGKAKVGTKAFGDRARKRRAAIKQKKK